MKCTDTPDEKPSKPESKPGKPGTLPKTGAAIFPLLLLAGGAGVGGFGLYKVSRRKK